MSRPRRHSPGGMVFHVLNRGVGRRVLFTKDEDLWVFERVVEETLRTRRMRLCAYFLMPNHWHFVVWPERDGDLPAFMQQVTNTHVKRWKEHRHEIGYGHLYQGRYKCFPVKQKTTSTRSFATWSGTPCVQTSWSERNRGAGRVCAVWSAKPRRFPSSRRGLCHAPPIGCKLSTNRKRKWRRCVAASIAVGPSAILTGSRTRPSDWGWNGRFGPVEGRRDNRRLATVTGGSLLFFLLYSPDLVAVSFSASDLVAIVAMRLPPATGDENQRWCRRAKLLHIVTPLCATRWLPIYSRLSVSPIRPFRQL